MVSPTVSLNDLQYYFESHPPCLLAAEPLKPNARIALCIDNSGTELTVLFCRTDRGSQVTLLSPSDEDWDFHFRVPNHVMRELIELPTNDLGEIGVFILRNLVAPPESGRKIKLRIKAGPWSIVRKGYLGVMSLGGRSVTYFLAQNNLSLTNLVQFIQRFRTHA